jgi:hypothetical protein
MDPSSCQKKKPPTGAYHKGNMNESRTQMSPRKEHIIDEERGDVITFILEKPSPIITTHFEIEHALVATSPTPSTYKMNTKLKEEGF